MTLAGTWTALVLAAFYYSNLHPDFRWIWTAALPAFFLETLFYLGSVFENTRTAWADVLSASARRAAALWISALLPYLVFSLAAGTFVRNALLLIAGLSAIYAFWYVVFPRRIAYDIGFLVIAAFPFVARVFGRLYQSPDPHLRVDILGHLMWIRLGVLILLVLREWNAGPFGLWPRSREWRNGFIWFAAAILPLTATALALHAVHYSPVQGPWWRFLAIAAGTFLGAFAVITLGEELFFRSVIQRAIDRASGSVVLAVILSSLLFGGVHLWYRHFPNWQWAVVATVLGVFCGIAYAQTGSIRASMVTHSLTIMMWRMIFQ
jgi:membrane protease YdiL (CAAX protease family)